MHADRRNLACARISLPSALAILSNALDKRRTPNGADRHASVECYVFKVAYCVECSHADSNMCPRSTSKNSVLGVVPKQYIGAVGANIGLHQKCKISFLGMLGVSLPSKNTLAE